MDSCVMGIFLEHWLAHTNKTTRANGIGGISNAEEILQISFRADKTRGNIL